MRLKRIALVLSGILAVSGCLFEAPDPTVDANTITFNDLPVHDPSVIRADDGSFYVFGSHLAAARSTDLMGWQFVANGVDANNPLWSTIPADGNAWTGIPGSWAADVIKLKNGKFYFYYSFCGVPPSGECNAPRAYLGVAVADQIEGPYTNLGIFLRSGMTAAEIAAGYGPEGITTYDPRIHPNTIDPDVFYDKQGQLWMTYGSYSGGIFILKMDEQTGRPLPGQGYGKHLAGGDHSAIEGSYILYSPETRYYYLFASFGGFVSTDGYNIRIARSRNPDGPYLDAEGQDLAGARGNSESIAPYGVKLMGGFNFVAEPGDTETSRGYLAPGHNSAYYDAATKKHFLITHTRFPNRGEAHSIRVHELFANKDGWLVASPHRYVPLKGKNLVDAIDPLGDYKFINHGKDINRTAKQSVYATLNVDGSITGEVTGTYKRYVSEPNRITIKLKGTPETFEGVLAWQWNEAAGKLVPTFTAVSSKGVSIWGSRLERKPTRQVVKDIAESLDMPEAVKDGTLDLPTRGTRGATIVWSSSDQDVISADGVVTRPNVGEGDRVVTLTARISLNGVTTTTQFQVNVPQRQPFNRVAHFGFESSLNESLGNFVAATATGDRIWNQGSVAFDAGREGQAVNLTGASGVRLPDGMISNYEYTVSFWIHPRAITRFTTGFFGAIRERTDAATGLPFSTQWLSFLPESWDGNTMLWSGSEAFFDGTAGERIAPNTWTHMAFSVNRGVVSVYLNGVRKFSAGTLGDFFTRELGIFGLGVNYWDVPFNGLIDELKVYEASLSGEEIKALDIDHLTTPQLLASAAALLSLGDISAVRENLTLRRTGPYAAAVSWESSDPAIISTSGKVNRPGRDSPDAHVTLTATLTLNGAQTTKVFGVTVRSLAPPTPVAAFGFEDNLSDATGGFGAGTVVGARVNEAGGMVSFAAGAVGRALVLNGASGVKLPDLLIHDHSYSISLWLHPTAVSQYTSALFGWATDSSWISVVPRGPGAQNTMLWSGTDWFDGTFNSPIPVGAWSHLVMTVNGGALNLYLNGQRVNSMTGFPDVFTPAAITQFAVGVNYWDPPYTGLVDQLQIYDEALALENVQTLYAEGLAQVARE